MLRLLTHALARLLPRDLRHQHGGEIHLDIDRRFAEGHRFSTLIDVATAVVTERRAHHERLPPSPSRRLHVMTGILQDARFAARMLYRRPWFSLAVILILGLGIGSATAIVSLADATLLRPLAVREPHRLADVPWNMSYPDFREIQKDADGFDDVLAYANVAGISLESPAGTLRVPATLVSANYFDMLGIGPAAGRLLQPADETSGGVPAIVISDRLWRSAFDRSPAIVGATMRVNSRPVLVAGVVPAAFKGLSLGNIGDVWMPAAFAPDLATGFVGRPASLTRGMSWLRVVGRLSPGVGLTEASARLDRFYNERHPPQSGARDPLVLQPVAATAATRTAGSGLKTFIALLFAVAAALLLLGCSNVANLLLARAASRRHEIGVRAALGAGRARLMQQLLVEGLMLGALGAAAGIGIAALTLRALGQYRLPGDVPIADLGLRVDGVIVASCAVLGLAAVTIFGPLPAWFATRRDVQALVREGGRGSTRLPAGRLLVALQVALCLALVGGGLLFARGLQRALSFDLGYEPAGVAMMSADPALQRLAPPVANAYMENTLERLRADPAVTHAGIAAFRPMRGGLSTSIYIEGRPAAGGEDPHVAVNLVSEGWMEAMRLRLQKGRTFVEADRHAAQRVGIVNETAARTFWPGRDAIGARFRFNQDPGTPAYEVVGVVADARYGAVDAEIEPFLYLSVFEPGLTSFRSQVHFFVRTQGDPEGAVAKIRDAARAANAGVPLSGGMTLEEHVGSVLMPQRLGLVLLLVFASAGIVLSAAGVYAIAAYSVSMRTREIGIRMALGAERARVVRDILRDGAVPVVIGLAAGAGLQLWASKFAESFVFGLDVRGPALVAGAAAIVTAAAAGALLLPARRAARVDPSIALRQP